MRFIEHFLSFNELSHLTGDELLLGSGAAVTTLGPNTTHESDEFIHADFAVLIFIEALKEVTDVFVWQVAHVAAEELAEFIHADGSRLILVQPAEQLTGGFFVTMEIKVL